MKLKKILVVIALPLLMTACATNYDFDITSPGGEHWRYLHELPDFNPAEHSDGCSGGMSAAYKSYRKFHGGLEETLPWRGCCEIHDKAYYYGGTREQKQAADERLKECVNENQGGSFLGKVMQKAVAFGGHPAFPTSYRWGYGESFRLAKEKGLSAICEKVENPDDNSRDVKSFWVDLNNYYKNNSKRKLVIFMDGTSNTKKSATNVWILYKESLKQACLRPGHPGHPVIPYYIKGLGTDWNDFISGNAVGSTAGKKIREAYAFLVQAYQNNDEIFIIGFSRGAFTARSLNGMLEYVGLLKKDKLNIDEGDLSFNVHLSKKIDQLYGAYNQHHDGTPMFFKQLADDIEAVKIKLGGDVTQKVSVKAIGVFDTVPALGEKQAKPTSGTLLFDNPSDHRLDLYAENGFHAMSLDEQRTAFKLLRFHQLINDNKLHSLEEVWFSGDHGNVGGKGEVEPGLSRISLEWMLRKFKQYHIFPDDVAAYSCGGGGEKCEEGALKDQFLDVSALWKPGRNYPRWPSDGDLVHGSVFCRQNIDSLKHAHVKREPNGKYTTSNLKNKAVYKEVEYECVN